MHKLKLYLYIFRHKLYSYAVCCMIHVITADKIRVPPDQIRTQQL
jgi:hypothetical protein